MKYYLLIVLLVVTGGCGNLMYDVELETDSSVDSPSDPETDTDTYTDTNTDTGGCDPECSGDKPVCLKGSCVARSIGDTCVAPSECESGFCSDGVCCQENCFRQCESCNAPSSVGSCVFVTTPRTPCTGSGPCKSTCDENTKNRSSCVYPGSGTPCGVATSCIDDLWTTASLCDDTGTCIESEATTCQYGCRTDGQPYCESGCASGDGLCNGTCVDILSSDEHCGLSCTACDNGSHCSAGKCVASAVHIKINSGGDIVAGGWEKGLNYIKDGETFYYGGTHDVSDVTDPAPNEVYQRVQHRYHYYNIPVPNGDYLVRIHFTEGYPTSAASRKMKYTIEGNVVLEDYNIKNAAGDNFKVVIEEFNTTVSDKVLNISCEEPDGDDVFEAAVEVISQW